MNIIAVVLSRSAGEDYGDDAIGYVQLLWRDGLCETAARITPGHRVATKLYSVTAIINELEDEILNVHSHSTTRAVQACSCFCEVA